MNKKVEFHFKLMQKVRVIHKVAGLSLAIFLFIISISGVLLGWKKNSNEWIMPATYKGTSLSLSDCLPLDSLSVLANTALIQKTTNSISLEQDRIDIRPNKGVAKISYKNHIWMVQLDVATGKVLNVGKRRSDVIEAIHDGSILDQWFGTSNGEFKLLFTSLMGLAILLFIASGFWLWYGRIYMNNISI